MSLSPLAEFCRRQRYDLIVENEESIVDTRRNPHWSKIRALRKWLPFYEYVVWLDADVIVTDLDFSFEKFIEPRMKRVDDVNKEMLRAEKQAWVESHPHQNPKNFDGSTSTVLLPRPEVLVGNDWLGMNTGIMAWHNSTFSLDLLRRMWSVPQELCAPYNDQGALKYLITPTWRGRPQKLAEFDLERVEIVSASDGLNRVPAGFLPEWVRTQPDIAKDLTWRAGESPFCHFANCKAQTEACMEWAQYVSQVVSCAPKILPRVDADRTTISRPFYRTDLNAVAPALDEPLLPLPTLLVQTVKRNPNSRSK